LHFAHRDVEQPPARAGTPLTRPASRAISSVSTEESQPPASPHTVPPRHQSLSLPSRTSSRSRHVAFATCHMWWAVACRLFGKDRGQSARSPRSGPSPAPPAPAGRPPGSDRPFRHGGTVADRGDHHCGTRGPRAGDQAPREYSVDVRIVHADTRWRSGYADAVRIVRAARQLAAPVIPCPSVSRGANAPRNLRQRPVCPHPCRHPTLRARRADASLATGLAHPAGPDSTTPHPRR